MTATSRWVGAAIGVMLAAVPAAHGVVIRVGESVGPSGGAAQIAAVLDTGGALVAGVQNDIDVVPPLRFGQRADGRPDCAANPAVSGAAGAAFAFVPCADAGCTALRAIVLSLTAVDPIPDGAQLYSCRIQIDGDAPDGAYPLRVTNPGASSPAGDALPADGLAGNVTVGDAPVAVVRIDDATAPLGGFTPIGVRLISDTELVTMSNEMALSAAFHVTSDVEQRPSCRVSLPGVSGSFLFVPAGCSPDRGTCTAVAASVRSSQPLPNDVELYRCTIFPVPVLDPGSYAAACTGSAAGDAGAQSVPSRCEGGVLQVLSHDDGPTPTPAATAATTTASGSPTPSAVLRRTATATPAIGAADDDGCAIAPITGGSSAPLIGPALWLAWRRRCRRGAARSRSRRRTNTLSAGRSTAGPRR